MYIYRGAFITQVLIPGVLIPSNMILRDPTLVFRYTPFLVSWLISKQNFCSAVHVSS